MFWRGTFKGKLSEKPLRDHFLKLNSKTHVEVNPTMLTQRLGQDSQEGVPKQPCCENRDLKIEGHEESEARAKNKDEQTDIHRVEDHKLECKPKRHFFRCYPISYQLLCHSNGQNAGVPSVHLAKISLGFGLCFFLCFALSPSLVPPRLDSENLRVLFEQAKALYINNI